AVLEREQRIDALCDTLAVERACRRVAAARGAVRDNDVRRAEAPEHVVAHKLVVLLLGYERRARLGHAVARDILVPHREFQHDGDAPADGPQARKEHDAPRGAVLLAVDLEGALAL